MAWRRNSASRPQRIEEEILPFVSGSRCAVHQVRQYVPLWVNLLNFADDGVPLLPEDLRAARALAFCFSRAPMVGCGEVCLALWRCW